MSARDSGWESTEESYWRTLLGQDPASLCKRTLATFDPRDGTYLLRVVDLDYKITPSTQTIINEADSDPSSVSWDLRLLILAYLRGGSETPLADKWVSPIEFSGGDLFFSANAHNLNFAELLLAFKSPSDFTKAGEKIGAKREKIGDCSFILQTLPRIPILFIYWAGDDELPSKISVLVDKSASSHLAVDGLWLAIKVSEKRILQTVKSTFH